MKINKQQLHEALEIVKPGLASKEIIEQSTSFAFIRGRVVTYNDEISLSHPLPGLDIEGAVRAEKLYQLLGKTKAAEIDISMEGNEVVISAGKARAGIPLVQEIKLPLDEEITVPDRWHNLPKNFTDRVDFCIPCCGRDMSRPILTCVHVQDDVVEASDAYRISQCTLSDKMPVKSFLLPASSALTMCRLQPTQVAEGKGWIHFKTAKETILSCRVFEEKYPDVSKYIVVEGTEIALPASTMEILERGSIFAKQDHILDEAIQITLQDKHFTIRGETEDGWFEETVPVRYTNDPVTFSIAPYSLKSILAKTLDMTLAKDRLKFEGDGWIYVTALKALNKK